METKPARILLVEDEPNIAEFIATILRAEQFEVSVERDGMRGMIAAHQSSPDLVILDRMLPSLDGIELCRRLRKTSDVPILMLTALDKPSDRVEGLNCGASDYLPKPFDLDELIARVNVQLRKRNGRPRTFHALGDLTLDEGTREVFRAEQRIALTPKEFDLLALFLRHPRQLLTRQQLLDAVWGQDFYGEDNVLEVYVHYLRAKIEKNGWSKMIHTVRGVGYLIKPGEAM